MDCYRIDESGYTGFDLLNADQPFQGAAAIAIGDDDAARLIREHFPKLQANELKYRALSRRSANGPRLLALLRDLLAGYKSGIINVATTFMRMVRTTRWRRCLR